MNFKNVIQLYSIYFVKGQIDNIERGKSQSPSGSMSWWWMDEVIDLGERCLRGKSSKYRQFIGILMANGWKVIWRTQFKSIWPLFFELWTSSFQFPHYQSKGEIDWPKMILEQQQKQKYDVEIFHTNRSHGHSCKNRNATSNVAPPQFSNEYKLLNLCATNGEIFRRSWVRTRVASNDWCASRNVVSINNNSFRSRTALAKAFGPSFTKISRNPLGGSVTTFSSHLKWSNKEEEKNYFILLNCLCRFKLKMHAIGI